MGKELKVKKYLEGLLKKWDSYEEYGGQEAFSFMNDIEMLLEFWDERIGKSRRVCLEDEESPHWPLDDGGEEFLVKLSKQSK